MKKTKNAFMSLMCAGFSLMIACSPAAHIEKDRNTDFSKFKTYSWMEKEGDRSSKHSVNNLAEQNIREAISQQLEKEGWREARNQPDVLIGVDVLVEKSTKESSNPVYSRPYSRLYYNPYLQRWGTIYYPSQFLGYDKDTYNTKEGTITISMIDVQTDKMVWQGWSTEEVNNNNLTKKEIQAGVKSIFRKFDVAKN